jgi:hypothetical protein
MVRLRIIPKGTRYIDLRRTMNDQLKTDLARIDDRLQTLRVRL